MYDTQTQQPSKLNGLDLAFLHQTAEGLVANPPSAQARVRVASRWLEGTRSSTSVGALSVGEQTVERVHSVVADEPLEFGGGDSALQLLGR